MHAKKLIIRVYSIFFITLYILALAFGPLNVTQARAAGILYAKPVISGTGDCSSWANACILQTALTGALSGDVIWVAAGTYKPTTIIDRAATFQLKDGVTIYGGFAGTEATLNQRNPAVNLTTLSGDIGTAVDNSDNSYHVVTGATGAKLDGFTITAGNANGSSPNDRGGGLYNNNIDNPTLTNLTLSGNFGTLGGGMYNYSSHLTLMNVTIRNNNAVVGGGMYNDSSDPVLENITFSGNSADDSGGGMGNYYSNPTLINVTFSGNSAQYGGGIGNSFLSNAQIRNTILWGNTAAFSGAQIYNSGSSSTAVVSYSVVHDGCPAGSTCTSIITADPRLGTLGNYGGSTQTFSLLPGSSGINAGNNATCAVTDQRGIPRPQGTVCDIGAFEYDYTGIYYIKPVVSGTGNCQSWKDTCTIHDALTTVISSDEIWAATGNYSPTTGTDRTATFQLKNGVALYGGFAGTETTRNQRNPTVNVTILSGDIGTPGINSDNSYHVVTGATGATLDGFTITAGNANGSSPNDRGGGMYNYLSDPALMNILFSGNSATYYGGGMYNFFSDPSLSGITFSGNSATYHGGGIYNDTSLPVLTDVIFAGNTAQYGGGMRNEASSPTLTNVTFSNNSATNGGGMNNHLNSSPVLTNVTFSDNLASTSGGGMYNDSSCNPLMTNVTFSGNSAKWGGGMGNYVGSDPQIHNTILWGNTASTSGAQVDNDSSTPEVSYSVVEGGYTGGTNIITADPKLGMLGNHGGFTPTIPLLPGSSAINAGDDSACAATDQRGITRPQGDHCDIGAYEFEYGPIYYVRPAASGLDNCQSWDNACTLQFALTFAFSGDEIWAAAGTYKPAIGPDRLATFLLKNGVSLYGGFAGTETARNQRNPAANLTTLSGDIGIIGINSDNSYHVVTGVTGATLDGFSITAGNANGTSDFDDCGGGMYNYFSNPILANIIFTANMANNGGGMYNYFSSPVLMNVTFSGNTALGWGGGMGNYWSYPALTNVTISRNGAESGGGIYTIGGSPVLKNVTISGNSAINSGGGLGNENTDPNNPQVSNTILWGNSAAISGAQIYNNSSTPIVSYTVIQDGYVGGTNIITADPKLGILGYYGGFTETIPLLSGSSAINAGNNSTCATIDQRGVTRPQGASCDIGAFELVDTTAPETVIINKPTNRDNDTTPTFTFTGDDGLGSGIASFKCRIDTGLFTGCTSPFTSPALADGLHIFNVYAIDMLGNADATPASYTWTLDSLSPNIVSIIRASPNPTKAAIVDFTVTFSQAVVGVDASDFILTKTGAITGESVTVVGGGPVIYTVSVVTGSGSGTLRLDVSATANINSSGHILAGLPYTGGEWYFKLFTIFLPLVLH